MLKSYARKQSFHCFLSILCTAPDLVEKHQDSFAKHCFPDKVFNIGQNRAVNAQNMFMRWVFQVLVFRAGAS